MKFQKGFDERRNLKGRPRGSKKSPDEMREWVTHLIEKNWHRLEKAMDAMDDRQAAYFMAQHLFKWRLPTPTEEVMRLSDEDFARLIKELEARRKEELLTC